MLLRSRMLLVSVGLVVALGACAGEAEGPGGALEAALAKARPMHDVTDPKIPRSLGDERWEAPVPLPELVSHRLEVAATLTLTVGTSTHTLIIHRSIARDGRRFRVIENREHREPSVADPAQNISTAMRFEAVYDGVAIAVKRGTGPFIERDARDGLPARILSQLHDFGPSLLRAFDDYLVKQPGAGRAPEIADLRLEWQALTLDRDVAPRPMPEAELTQLRDHDRHVFAWAAATFRPTWVNGKVAHLAGRTYAPQGAVEIELALSGSVRGAEGAPGSFALELEQRVSTLGESALANLRERAPAEFVLPAERLPADRPRPWKMIVDVLGEDLLPPYHVDR